VADGVDPRIGALLDTSQRGAGRSAETTVSRIFVYQRNLERMAEDPAQLNEELDRALEDELCASFPELAVHATPRDKGEHVDHADHGPEH
jgi:hypothetical protein